MHDVSIVLTVFILTSYGAAAGFDLGYWGMQSFVEFDRRSVFLEHGGSGLIIPLP